MTITIQKYGDKIKFFADIFAIEPDGNNGINLTAKPLQFVISEPYTVDLPGQESGFMILTKEEAKILRDDLNKIIS